MKELVIPGTTRWDCEKVWRIMDAESASKVCNLICPVE